MDNEKRLVLLGWDRFIKRDKIESFLISDPSSFHFSFSTGTVVSEGKPQVFGFEEEKFNTPCSCSILSQSELFVSNVIYIPPVSMFLNSNKDIFWTLSSNKLTHLHFKTEHKVKQIGVDQNHWYLLCENGTLWRCSKENIKSLLLNKTQSNCFSINYSDSTYFQRFLVTSNNNELNSLSINIVQFDCHHSSVICKTNTDSIFIYHPIPTTENANNVNEIEMQEVDELGGLDIKKITIGVWHATVLTKNGDIYHWGWLQALGMWPSTPTLIEELDIENDIAIDISSGAEHTIALLNNNRVFGWGRNIFGQLGDVIIKEDNNENNEKQSIFIVHPHQKAPFISPHIIWQLSTKTNFNHMKSIVGVYCGAWNSFLVLSKE
eukprot:c19559_g1_i1.p1 GENE.c19559_g1_i1~~c19559_g1_i1.p1  ORF type:complete len:377 (-),score=128.19 c19559_g1_i1:19-1149(-)